MKITEATVRIVESFNQNGPSWRGLAALFVISVAILLAVISIAWITPDQLSDFGSRAIEWAKAL